MSLQRRLEWYWLAEGLGLVPAFISGLCPFTSVCLSVFPAANVCACWFKPMVVLSALIEMYWSQGLRATYVATWIFSHRKDNRQPIFCMYTLHFMSFILLFYRKKTKQNLIFMWNICVSCKQSEFGLTLRPMSYQYLANAKRVLKVLTSSLSLVFQFLKNSFSGIIISQDSMPTM